ncbi:MAG TPA: hypothetical protein VJZ26_09275 [Blastocatellia bacterium]|nr:hypothetical protein [Blastocatellia bacterium]
MPLTGRAGNTLLPLSILFLSVNAARGQVTYERLLKASEEPHNWLTYSGDYAGRRHSALDQINASNVQRLEAQWSFQMESRERFETTPLVVDGVMYVTGPSNRAYALGLRGKATRFVLRR